MSAGYERAALQNATDGVLTERETVVTGWEREIASTSCDPLLSLLRNMTPATTSSNPTIAICILSFDKPAIRKPLQTFLSVFFRNPTKKVEPTWNVRPLTAQVGSTDLTITVLVC